MTSKVTFPFSFSCNNNKSCLRRRKKTSGFWRKNKKLKSWLSSDCVRLGTFQLWATLCNQWSREDRLSSQVRRSEPRDQSWASAVPQTITAFPACQESNTVTSNCRVSFLERLDSRKPAHKNTQIHTHTQAQSNSKPLSGTEDLIGWGAASLKFGVSVRWHF